MNREMSLGEELNTLPDDTGNLAPPLPPITQPRGAISAWISLKRKAAVRRGQGEALNVWIIMAL